MTTLLGRLFNQYGSDKERNGYTSVYHTILKHMRPNVTELLEVGIGTLIPNVASSMVGYSLPGYAPGGSLRAWRDWLPNARITGVDVQKDCLFEETRIRTFLADSQDPNRMDELLSDETFDVIIDDGLHLDTAQIATMKNLLPRVRSGGFYVVEDIYPGSRFFDLLRNEPITKTLEWFTTEHKNIAVFSCEISS